MDATAVVAVIVLFAVLWACIVVASMWAFIRWAKSKSLFNAIRVYCSLKLYKPDHAAINKFMYETVEEWVKGSRTRYWALKGIVKRAAELYPDDPTDSDDSALKEIAEFYPDHSENSL